MQKDAGEYNIKRQNIPEKESVYNQRYRYKAGRGKDKGQHSAVGVIKMRLRLGEREQWQGRPRQGNQKSSLSE